MRLVFLAAALAVWAVTPTARAGDLEEVLARGELRWAGDLQGGEPYVFEAPGAPGDIQGFEVDIARARRLRRH